MNNKRKSEGRFFTTKKQAKPTVIKNIKNEKKKGGFFSFFNGECGTYTDLPPVAAVSSGIAVCILLKVYLEKHLNLFWLILLAIFTIIPSLLSFLRDAKEEK